MSSRLCLTTNQWKWFLSSLICVFIFTNSHAQTEQETFGQNRVQYKDFTWSYYNSDRFNVYFYLGGQELGKFTILSAEKEIENVEDKLEYKLNDKIDILVYNNLGDLKQSNLGFSEDQNNTGGTTKIVGNKMFIYFDGNHQHLLRQIREGIAKICLQNMMYGGSIQDILQNAVLLNLPDWFSEGLASYVGEPWNTEQDNRLRDGILSGKYKKFNRLSGADAKFAGQSVWYYIEKNYGASAIPNILYLTRINRSVSSGFSFVLSKPLSEILDDWYNFFYKQYSKDLVDKSNPKDDNVIPLKIRKKFVYNQFRLNTTADKVGYVRNDLGKYKVRMTNLEKKRSKTVLRGGFRNITQPIDYSYPLLAWDPTGTKLAMIFEKRSKTFLWIYDTEKKKKQKIFIANFQKILSFSFGPDPKTLIISAVNRGQSDIYMMNIATFRVTQITNDFYDDLNPHWIKLANRTVIAWSSNRRDDTLRNNQQLDTILPTGSFDLYYYNLKTKSNLLTRVSTTPNANESNPIAYNSDYFAYTSDRNGINNRYIAYIDSTIDHYDHYFYFPDSTVVNPKYNIDSLIAAKAVTPDSTDKIPVYRDVTHSFPNTNYSSNILEQETLLKSGAIGELMLKDGSYRFYKTPIQKEVDLNNVPVLNKTYYAVQSETKPAPKVLKPPTPTAVDTAKSDTAKSKANNSVFQSDFSNAIATDESSETEPSTSGHKQNKLKFSKILPYFPRFSADNITTQLDNSLLVTRYESFVANGGQFVNPDLSALIKLSTTDMFEDYRITGGFSIPTDFSGTKYFLTYENLKKRLDKKFTYYREVDDVTYSAEPYWPYPVYGKSITNYVEGNFTYPIDVTKSLRGILSYRMNKVVFLSSDSFSLNVSNYTENWGAFRGEYVYDNTLKLQTNILTGTRYKIYGDIERLIQSDGSFLYAVGGDFRHYERINRNLIWATRVSGATSWGGSKIVYYLGGVDNWVSPVFNTNTPVNQNAGYAFQTIATSMRGFDENARNGNSFLLLNTELRFPIFSYLVSTPIRSEIARNFQIIAFTDAGSAWEGASPYEQGNPFNTTTITQGPVSVQVNYFKQPIIVGYGMGIRTTILGYFLRLDYAQGYDSGVFNKPILYFSIGTDF